MKVGNYVEQKMIKNNDNTHLTTLNISENKKIQLKIIVLQNKNVI